MTNRIEKRMELKAPFVAASGVRCTDYGSGEWFRVKLDDHS